VELIGRRWSGAVIHILMKDSVRYAELRDAIPDITDRMLSERLRELEDEGIVTRKVIPEIPIRVEYSLTAKGKALEPALGALGHWAERWGSKDAPPDKAARPAATPALKKRSGSSKTLIV
jgi:DNA-binding HxlR family transcriptional regulator